MSQNNLCEKTLSSELSTQALELFNEIHLLQEVTSTNDYLLKQSQQQKKNLICITPLQTAGRGQRGKTWISQADDICFSLLWITQLPLEKLTGLSILTGIAIAESIQTFLPHHKIQLKWPNDLLVNKKKLGGVLIESTKHKKDSAIVIGIGINNAHAPKTNQPTTSLKELQSTHAKAESVIAAIINNLTE